MRGLCNDHNSLRDLGRKLQTDRDSLTSEKTSLRDSLTALQDSHAENVSSSRRLTSRYKERIVSLEKAYDRLQQQLEDEKQKQQEAVPRPTEPTDFSKLEATLAQIAQDHERLRQDYSEGSDQVCLVFLRVCAMLTEYS